MSDLGLAPEWVPVLAQVPVSAAVLELDPALELVPVLAPEWVLVPAWALVLVLVSALVLVPAWAQDQKPVLPCYTTATAE